MPIAPTTPPPIALLGTGLLGSAIATRLLQQGESLWVWNRTPERCAPLLKLGAQGASDAQAAVRAAGWVITVLSDGPTTEAVLQQLGPDLAGKGVIQIGTIGPDQSQALAAAVEAWGGRYLEAPVLGSRPEALAGQLQLMAGGSAELVAEAMPLLRHLATAPVHVGPVGSAMATKLALNQLIASLTHSFSLSLHLVQRSGVAVDTFMELLRGSALHAPTFDKKLDRELQRHYGDPNFPTAHLRKDLTLFEAAAQRAGLNAGGLSGLLTLLQGATAAGLDPLDYCALHELTAGHATAGAPD
jgi:3-hydroxyisobutyrate dehydrogenase